VLRRIFEPNIKEVTKTSQSYSSANCNVGIIKSRRMRQGIVHMGEMRNVYTLV
jgi:hypothetical protein